MQQPNSDEPKTPSLSQQDSVDNPPEEQLPQDSEQPADYSQTSPWQLREQTSRNSATEKDQPVATSHLTSQFQGAVQEPTPSQDHDHANNSGAVVMTINEKNWQGKSAVTKVQYVPRSSDPKVPNSSQQDSIGNASMKQKLLEPEQLPAYSQTPDYPQGTPLYPYQPTGSYTIVPTKGYQPVSTKYATEGPSQTNNSTAAVTTQPTVVQFTNAPYVNDYLPLSCFSCLCCCWMLGCAAILGSLQARHRLSVGDYEGAKQAAKIAKTLGLAAVVIGGFLMLIVIILRYS